MAGKALELTELLSPDQLGTAISNRWVEWNTFRNTKLAEWQEVRKYIFATDTTTTSNSSLPWNNKTTIPKLCQIRDNLSANYLASMFPRRDWLDWEADNKEDQTIEKSQSIKSYMSWVVDQVNVKEELNRLVHDFIDYGNAFAMPEWVSESHTLADGTEQKGYTGPGIRRISPLDIVFNPTAPTFRTAPKIIRSLLTMGEIKELIEKQTATEEDKEAANILFDYLVGIRKGVAQHDGEISEKDALYEVDGFGSFSDYLKDDLVEVLTFYGDMFDHQTGIFYKNHIIMVADRHKIISNKPNPSLFGYPTIYHVGWRIRQDNIWAMGPLDNLVGMQYRIDHLENLKADIFDLTAYPTLLIKGYVEDFVWGPLERIYAGDDGSVELLSPDVQALQANFEISNLEQKMEEMAGAPKEALGFRTPGEKTAFEVQRLENAAARIFQSKVAQFETQMTEPLLNGMLELARRNLTSETIRLFDTDFNISVFTDLTVEDITGSGRIKPKAAQHFAEKATLMQNLTNLLNSPLGADPAISVHISGLRLAQMAERILDLESEDLVVPYIRLSEQADAQRLDAANQELFAEEVNTPSGLFPDDFDQEVLEEEVAQGAQEEQVVDE